MFNELGSQQLSKVDYHYLDTFFRQQNIACHQLNLTRVHGILTAVISAPTLIKPTEWLSLIFQGEPTFDNVLQAEKVMNLIIGLFSQTTRELKGEQPYQILLWEGLENAAANQCSDELLKHWCDGYLSGVQLDPLWGTDKSALAMLTPFLILAQKKSFIGQCDNQGLLIESDVSFIEQYKGHLLDFIQDNYAYWLSEREEDLSRKQALSPKSLDEQTLCPCDSLKAYEECCYDAEATLH